MTKKTRRNFLKDLGGFALAISGLESIAKLADAKAKFQIPILKQINGIPTKNLNDFKDFDEKYTRLIYNDSKKTGYHLFFVGKRSEFETLIRHGLWSGGKNRSPFPNEEAYVAVEHKSKKDEWVVYETGTSVGKSNQIGVKNNIKVINSYPKEQYCFYDFHTQPAHPAFITALDLLKKADSDRSYECMSIMEERIELDDLFKNKKITEKKYKEKAKRLYNQQMKFSSALKKPLKVAEPIFIDQIGTLYPSKEDLGVEWGIENVFCQGSDISNIILSPFGIIEYNVINIQKFAASLPDGYTNAIKAHQDTFKMPDGAFKEVPSNYLYLSEQFKTSMEAHFEKFQFEKYGVKASMRHYKR